MTRNLPILATALAACLSASAQQTGSPSVAHHTPLVDSSPATKLPKWFQIGGQVRGRFESPTGTSLTSSTHDSYYLSRIRVDLSIRPVSWLRFFAQAQDARTAAYNSVIAPSTLYNPMDLRQGYVSVSREGALAATLSVGRQELPFGVDRLIGPAYWGMSRTFNAADLSLTKGAARLDLIAGSAVQIDNNRFDRHKPGEHMYGAYGSVGNVLPGMRVEHYVLFKQNVSIKSETGIARDALIVSPGIRVTGKIHKNLDYAIKGLFQRGTYSSDRAAATGQTYSVGWTIANAILKPRVSVEYNYASGDPATKDGSRNTFDQLYPSNHSYYGMIDQFGWKNMNNWWAGADFSPTKKLKIRADFNEFYLATVKDSLYASSGSSAVLNRNATSGHVGAELNAVAVYQCTKLWKAGAGCGRLCAGQYLKESESGFGYNYPHVMSMGTF